MNATVPAVLAVAGTALMAAAIFGPFRRAPAETPAGPQWPTMVAASAVACDVPARIDLAEGLGALGSPWAESVLRAAYETEPDPGVRAAIAAALSSSQSLVT